MNTDQARWGKRALVTTFAGAALALRAISHHARHDMHDAQTFGVTAFGVFLMAVCAWGVVCKSR